MLAANGPQGSPGTSAAESVESALDRDAKLRRKGEHNKLIGKLAVGGGVGTLVLCVILLVVADMMGRAIGAVFVFLAALLATVGFATLLVPHYAEAFIQRVPAPEDPLTGRPMRILWWWRCLSGAIAVFMFFALGVYIQAPLQPASASHETSPATSPTRALTAQQLQQQTLDARLALCVAADEIYPGLIKGEVGNKSAIILANQFLIGQRAGGLAIRRAWGDYLAGKWQDSDCHALSVAPWAEAEGYASKPNEIGTINLPDGAIRAAVVSTYDVVFPGPESENPETQNPEGTIGKPEREEVPRVPDVNTPTITELERVEGLKAFCSAHHDPALRCGLPAPSWCDLEHMVPRATAILRKDRNISPERVPAVVYGTFTDLRSGASFDCGDRPSPIAKPSS